MKLCIRVMIFVEFAENRAVKHIYQRGAKVLRKDISKIYLYGYLTCVFFGSLGPMEAVWEISDIFNGMMAVPNLLALILLVGEVRKP